MPKACFKCGETKPLDAFYRHPMMLDGHLNKCAECTKVDVRSNRQARIEYYQAYDRARAKLPERREKRLAEAHRYTPKPEPVPIKRAARVELGNALRDGRVRKPPECQVCAVSGELHGHHEDYSKPLEVIWVCRPCHALIHNYWRARERAVA